MTLKELISQMSQRPAMFLGDPTISRLEAFIAGWTLELHDTKEIEILSGFKKWVAERYRVQGSHSWVDIIRFYTPDGPSALTEAFKLFTEYFELIEMQRQSQ